MKRFKSYTLWVAVSAFIGMFVQDLGIDIAPERYTNYVDSILYILVLAGIISSPDKEKLRKK
ncbi:holin [Priestia endophytica]|uniref:holin n=1 Tax=Priestia endophytica TaxID=135735 RepID=UPI002281F75D|nr:holin [Priestia endophytica]MCY8231625.1 holin [Priestia endophytica]